MTRDYSQFLPRRDDGGEPARPRSRLETLGWTPFFSRQIGLDDLGQTPPVRVVEVHRTGLRVLGEGLDLMIPPGPEATVGDWLLLDRAHPPSSAVLERKSLFKRRAPGTGRGEQLIAANVDTAFIVTSCNLDFNEARLERFLSLALEAGTTAVIVLTKADLCDDPAPYVEAARALSDEVEVIVLNALSDEPKSRLVGWCLPGRTVVFLGASGVGKSTLVNALLDEAVMKTAPIREDDARGRHTTSQRQLHFLPNGCAVLDTPGIRELQLTDARDGIDEVFADLSDLAARCRFSDCRHETEPGCAVRAALEAGELDEARLARWRKLATEERLNTATLAQRRSRDRALHKMYRAAQKKNRE